MRSQKVSLELSAVKRRILSKKFLTEYWGKKPSSFISVLFIYTCLFGNGGTGRRYTIAQMVLPSELKTICGPAAWILLSSDARTSDRLDAGLNKVCLKFNLYSLTKKFQPTSRNRSSTQFLKMCQVQIIYLPNSNKIVFKPIKNSQE